MSLRAFPRSAALLVAAACAVLPALLAASCGSLPEPKLCGEIPANGCPAGRGGTCDDPTCAALYDCVGGEWTVAVSCPAHDGGPGSDAGDGGDAGDSGAGGGPCTPFEFDHTGETDNCEPSLETPDCPAAAAEGCLEMACDVDCLDFYLCKASVWVHVGFCTNDGTFHDTQGHGGTRVPASRDVTRP